MARKKKKDEKVEATPLEVWAKRFPYKIPSAPKKGPLSKSPSGDTLIGTQPYYGPRRKRKTQRGRQEISV